MITPEWPRSAWKLACLWLASSLAPAAVADEYSWQLAGVFRQYDGAGISDSDHLELGATYYPTAVNDSHGPLLLAPFLDRSSYVTVGLSRGMQTNVLDGYHLASPEFIRRLIELYGRSTTETVQSSVSGRNVWSETGWYVGGTVERTAEDERPSMRDTTANAYRVRVGKYLGDATTLDLTLGIGQEMQEPDEVTCPDLGSVCFGFAGGDTDTETAAVSFRHVGELWGDTWSVLARVESLRFETRVLPARLAGLDGQPNGGMGGTRPDVSYSDDRRVYSLFGQWFPTDRFGVQLSYAKAEPDAVTAETRNAGLSATWFFRRNVSAGVSLVRTRGPVGSSDRTIGSVRLSGRF